MAGWLKATVAFVDDPNLFPKLILGYAKSPATPVLGIHPMPSSGLHRHLLPSNAHIDTNK